MFSVMLVNIKIMIIMMEVERKLKNVKNVEKVITHQKNWNSPILNKCPLIFLKFALNQMILGIQKIVIKCEDGI